MRTVPISYFGKDLRSSRCLDCLCHTDVGCLIFSDVWETRTEGIHGRIGAVKVPGDNPSSISAP